MPWLGGTADQVRSHGGTDPCAAARRSSRQARSGAPGPAGRREVPWWARRWVLSTARRAKVAAVGATAGAVAARGQSRKQAQQQQASAQQQASTQQSAKQQDYLKARGACLEGKGYSVK